MSTILACPARGCPIHPGSLKLGCGSRDSYLPKHHVSHLCLKRARWLWGESEPVHLTRWGWTDRFLYQNSPALYPGFHPSWDLWMWFSYGCSSKYTINDLGWLVGNQHVNPPSLKPRNRCLRLETFARNMHRKLWFWITNGSPPHQSGCHRPHRSRRSVDGKLGGWWKFSEFLVSESGSSLWGSVFIDDFPS